MEAPGSNGDGPSLDYRGIDSHPRHDKPVDGYLQRLENENLFSELETEGTEGSHSSDILQGFSFLQIFEIFAETEAERHKNCMTNIETLIDLKRRAIRAASIVANMTALETKGTEGSHYIDIDAGGFQNTDFSSSVTQPATISYPASGEAGSARLVGRLFPGLLFSPCQKSEKDLCDIAYFKPKSQALYSLEFPPRTSELNDISRFTAVKVLNIMNKLETQGKQGSHCLDTGSVIQEPNNKLSAWTIPMIILSVLDGSIFTLLATASQDPNIGGLMSKYWSRIILGILTLSLTYSFLIRVFYKKLPAKFANPASYLAIASNGATFFLAAATYMGAI